MRFDPVEFMHLVDGLTLEEVGAATKLMLRLWQFGPMSEQDVRKVCKAHFDAVKDLLCDVDGLLSYEFVEAARIYGKRRQAQTIEAGRASAAKRNDRSTTVEHVLNDRSTDVLSISKSVSKSKQGKEPEVKKIVTTSLDFNQFRARCLEVHKANSILSDAEAKAFFDYWTEGHPETKPRYASADRFDIAKRMGTWKRNNFTAKPAPPTPSPTAKPWIQ
jgi:hypothetical protein